ncbi:CD151 antigen isoform X6 [Balaenoptera musculus]|uniref:CD151 antigen isoform X6 n=1 Tax=Balaenoptera musculus TaxID=9771 RepID=A0A8B8Y7G7_BALMU|nr:CD151 antigen isoform X6 [Balaenoptera musculus]
MWHHLPQVPALHLQLLLLAGWSGRHGRGHLDTGPQERLHQPAGLGHLPGHSLHPGGGGRCRHGDWGSGLLRHLQGAEGPAASAECRAQGEPEGHHDQAVPSAGPRGRDQRCGQAAAGVPLLWQQQLAGLAGQRVDPLGRGRRPRGPRQLLQDRGGRLRAARPRLQHLQGGGRLHHQAGDLHPGAPEDHRGRGPRHRLCAGVRHDLHVLPVQEPEAGALLTLPAGRPSVCAAASRVR